MKSGPNRGQVSWAKHGGVRGAWIAACTRSGVLPFADRMALSPEKGSSENET